MTPIPTSAIQHPLTLLALVIVFCPIGMRQAAADEEKAKIAECRWTDAPITIDGKAEEKSWDGAEWIDDFSLPWLQEKSRPAKTATKARLLWDREYLYFFAEMEDGDLFANIKQHDGRLWENDVFELFFKPADDKPGYYEFQVNPAGAVLDMFIPRRGSGEYARYHNDGPFHVDLEVKLNGTLNKWSDKDQGWSVEGRIPWGDFLRSGGRPKINEVWKFALCRYDYSVDFEGPELSTSAPMKSKTHPDFHAWEDYAPLKFIGPDSNANRGIPQRVLLTTSRVAGSPDPPPPYIAKRAYPKLTPSFPIFAEIEPGSRRLLFIDQDRPYSETRICRTTNDPASGEYEVLLEISDTAYALAFHPRFAENGYLYLGSNGEEKASPKGKSSRITRYQLERKPPYKLLADSAQVVIDWPSDGHNGAAITFGRDGMMYITSGDGTSDSDVDLKGQGLDHLLSKVLRIDVDHPAAGKLYSVPKDNPFFEMENAAAETWAYGLRNPWRITTDPRTGDIWVGNNGQDLWEQVYLLERGANYGWSVYEGSHFFYPNRQAGPTAVSKPAAEHHHNEARSLTGGVVYYGEELPQLRGMYIYGDYSTGKIWAIRHQQGKVSAPLEIADTPLQISGFVIDADGELLVIDHSSPSGGFHRLVPRPAETAKHAFPRKLSASGLFASVAGHRMAAGVIPYSVNSPLWSDGAYKERYIALPGDAKIDFHATNSWSFPEGTVLVKSFALEQTAGDPASRKWIETRFFTRQQGEWIGYSYAWNADQTDADLVESQGRDVDIPIRTSSGEQMQKWRFPSRTECMVCHSRAANFVLGVSAAQLNRDHDYGGAVDNQLHALEALGVLKVDPRQEQVDHYRRLLVAAGLSGEEADKEIETVKSTRDQRTAPDSGLLLAKPPAAHDKLADPYDARESIEARARSYLHVNCASCHTNAGGGNAQIDLVYTNTSAKLKAIGEKPHHNTFQLQDAKIITPGSPARSVLLHRLQIRGTGQMPPLSTANVDERAVEVIRRWIEEMQGEE